jgi:hypothetical protein
VSNPLLYSDQSYRELYGSGEVLFQRAVASTLPPMTRFDAPEHLTTFGPLSHYYDLRAEVTYGYNPLALAAYSDYESAMQTNRKLRNGLNVSRWLDPQNGSIIVNPDVLPRAMFPPELVPVRSPEESRQKLATLDPSRQALVPEGLAVTAQDPAGSAQVTAYQPGIYRIHYKCVSPSLLRISNTWFPGWQAHVNGQQLPVVTVDHALIGVVTPAGEADLELSYRSTYFGVGVAVSLLTALGCLAALVISARKNVAPG